MGEAWFVTGTDTGVGKTVVSCALLHALRARGLRAVGMKPVASGCERTREGLLNEDVEALLRAGDPAATREDISIYRFEPPIAPHLAAAQAGVSIDIAAIVRRHQALASRFDAVVVEGAGGWLVPLDPVRSFADLAQALGLPVVLVVGMRLGCINHALLSAESILRRDLPLAGWVANGIDPDMACLQENVDTLRARIEAPLLGVIPHRAPADLATMVLDPPGRR
jgi:dethiobiotin synthetase